MTKRKIERTIEEILADIKGKDQIVGPESTKRFYASQELKNEFFVGKELTDDVIEICSDLIFFIADNSEYPFLEMRQIVAGFRKMGDNVLTELLEIFTDTEDIRSKPYQSYLGFIPYSYSFPMLLRRYQESNDAQKKVDFFELLKTVCYNVMRSALYNSRAATDLIEERKMYDIKDVEEVKNFVDEEEIFQLIRKYNAERVSTFDEVCTFLKEISKSPNSEYRAYVGELKDRLNTYFIYELQDILEEWYDREDPRYLGVRE